MLFTIWSNYRILMKGFGDIKHNIWSQYNRNVTDVIWYSDVNCDCIFHTASIALKNSVQQNFARMLELPRMLFVFQGL